MIGIYGLPVDYQNGSVMRETFLCHYVNLPTKKHSITYSGYIFEQA